MLYEMNKTKDIPYIKQYGKAYGTVLLRELLPNISRTKNMFLLDSYEDFLKIENQLPEIFSCRADAKTGSPPTLRSGRKVCKKIGCERIY